MKLMIPPPLQGVLIAVAMWFVHQQALIGGVHFPGQKWIAGLLIAVGVVMEIISVGTFFREKTTVNPLKPANASKLVVKGLYKISRNPMYLALAIALAGWALWLGNPLNIILIGAFVWYITMFQIKPEEAVLSEKFGAEYDAYKKKVRRWI